MAVHATNSNFQSGRADFESNSCRSHFKRAGSLGCKKHLWCFRERRPSLLSPAHDCDIPALSRPAPPEISGSITEAMKTIGVCQKPVVITGKTAIPYKDQVFQLASRIGAGIIPAQGARGIYPDTEGILLGGLGGAHIHPLLKQADCVLLIGACPYEHRFVPSNVQVVQIDIRPQYLAHHLRPITLTGDMALLLERLLGIVKRHSKSGVARGIKRIP